MNKYSNKIAITTGDPNGIGAEITIKALNLLQLPPEKCVIIGNKKIIEANNPLDLNYEIISIDYDGDINKGIDTKEGGEFSFQILKKASEIQPKAIVTAPVSKNAMHFAGHYFNGQTEVLEHFLAMDGQRAEMLFTSDDFRVLLLTRHIAICDIKLTKELIINKIQRLYNFFKTKTNISNPKIGLCALNPHAGENGVIGKEELDIIIPAVKSLQELGINISLPISADTLLANALKTALSKNTQPYDCYVAMYHDQGLIPIKALGLENVVNMTIGLNIIRTSPSHGTAFDIAGKNIANPAPMIKAIEQALSI